MKKKLDYIAGMVDEMVTNDIDRDKMYKEMDDYDRSIWEKPKNMEADHWRKTVSPAPESALNTAVKVLSAERPNIKFTPTGPRPEDLQNASMIERGLSWELRNASKRSPTLLVPDIVRSSIKYAETAVRVDYLPWVFDSQKTLGKSNPRRQAILRDGNFLVTAYNARSVHSRFSPMGLEAVALVQLTTGRKIVDQWGNRARKVYEMIKDEKKDVEFVLVDLTDYEQRAVYCWEGMNLTSGGALIEIINEEREVPFIPWIIKMSGSGLEAEEEYKRKPFLEGVYRARLWKTLNLVQTLYVSEAIAYAAAPRGKKTGTNPDSVNVDYGEPGRPISVGPGQDYIELNPPQIDRALTEIYDRTKAQLDAATSVQVLQNLNFPAGTAYATINAVLQTAIASLNPYKKLAEATLAGVAEKMLLWIDHAGGSIVSYGTGREDAGKRYEVTTKDFSVDAMYIDVELNASAPTDFMERITAGLSMLQMGYPKGRVFEQLNVADPEQAIAERYFEDMLNNEVQLKLEQRKMEQQMIMQQMMQQMMQPAPQPQGGTPPGPPGMYDNVGGGGFNPAAGGVPPAEAVPEGTREVLTGHDRSGLPLTEV